MYNKSEFENLTTEQKENNKFHVKQIISIIDVLEKKNIEDEEVSKMLTELNEMIKDYDHNDKDKRKAYRKAFNKLRNHVFKSHKLQPKDNSIGVGIAIGCAIGAGFGASGIAIGLGLGIAVGYLMEYTAEKEGRLY